MHHQVMRTVKISLWETLRSESILVSDHNQLKTCFLQFQQNGNNFRLEGEFVKAIDLKVTRRFGNQGSITVNKKILLAHTCSARKASMTRWLSSRVPTVIRRQPLNEGCLF